MKQVLTGNEAKLIEENFLMTVKGKVVEIIHNGFNKADTIDTAYMKQQISVDMNNGGNSGFHPYNNFKCSWEWILKVL